MIEAVLGPASEAYYSERVRSGSTARLRAQAAQSTVTLFAGGLVAALTFTALADRPMAAQAAGITAVVLWLLGALLYQRAVALPVRGLARSSHVESRLELLDEVLGRADEEAEQVDGWQRRANTATVLALAATALAFGLAVVQGTEKKLVPGTVAVTRSYEDGVRGLCDLPDGRLAGKVAVDSLKGPFLEVRVPAGTCTDGSTSLRIPRAAVRAVGLKSDD
ncbi:hypothetical protein GCM10010406_12250 [Streptomyces thermolineatus]|uniref:Integral membrane protein n=1 Tax=Streptomyces thermolineatus TaxID=44033 RepID=A0ABP5YG21_9ACTN